MNFEDLRLRVLDWSYARGLIEGATVEKFGLKLAEEAGEVSRELCSENYENAGMEIGDCFVVLINLCEKLNLDPVVCLKMAYIKIKNRNGKMKNGTFQKDDDLGDQLNTKQMHSMSEYFRTKAGMPKEFDVWRDAGDTETKAQEWCETHDGPWGGEGSDKCSVCFNPFGLGK